MQPKTVNQASGKMVPALCKRNDRLDDLDIAGRCFWLGMLYEGSARFEVGGRTVDVTAPCFVCFDDRVSPRLIKRRGGKWDSIYFDPTFINVNMTSARIHSDDYEDIASQHDFFLLRPFTDEREFVFPFFGESTERAKRLFAGMEAELSRQTDWYWSCRGRSYFMELIIMLERSYGYFAWQGDLSSLATVRNEHLQKAVLFVETHYADNISLADIAEAAAINHTTLTQLFKSQLSMTPGEYVWHHRLNVAKKQLEFTSLPIKDVAARCGFKTVQHFCRKFEGETGYTPAEFRDVRYHERLRDPGLMPL